MKSAIKYILIFILFSPVFVYLGWRQSLPQLDGETQLSSLHSNAKIQRDINGRVSIIAENELDAWRSAAYVAAQDRFFQMDLLRRASAGRLAELLGPSLVKFDKSRRIHGLSQVAQQVMKELTADQLALLTAYAEGVNAGLNSLGTRPFEYLILNHTPQPWVPSDSLMVLYTMYFDLNDQTGKRDRDLAVLHESMPLAVYEYLNSMGSKWDASIDGSTFDLPPIPSELGGQDGFTHSFEDLPEPGSNNWAVSGLRTTDNRAILADDMHLGLRLPHIWYPLHIEFKHQNNMVSATGVNLPGVPAIVAGSNTLVAWGYTNAYVDTTDIVQIQWNNTEKTQYKTSAGIQEIIERKETILVKGSEPISYTVIDTIWGPILPDTDYAISWIAHHPQAATLYMPDFVKARDLDSLLNLANKTGSPPQNFIAVDNKGQIAWTIMGQLPIRKNFDPDLPADWSQPDTGWFGWIQADDMPRIINPDNGQLWSANSRVVGGDMLDQIGSGGYGLGARAKQIRDRLAAKQTLTETDLFDIQLDDEALFLIPWQTLALTHVKTDDPAYTLISNWGARASINSSGYRIVRAFRNQVLKNIRSQIINKYIPDNEKFAPRIPLIEDRAWALIQQDNDQFFEGDDTSWNTFLTDSLEEVINELSSDGQALHTKNWGQKNTLKMQHPLSPSLPMFSAWLDMPSDPLPGDNHMPRVQSPGFGASERFVVSPGHEEDGFFQMPGGVSGHPLSPFYSAGHSDWVNGVKSSFLPGETMHTLELTAQ